MTPPASLCALIPTLFAILGLGSCLDAREGGLAAGADVLETTCPPGSAQPFARLSPHAGGAALGPCGHLAWIDHAGEPWARVILTAPNGRHLATYPEEAGFFSHLAFAPGDALFAYQTLRSDLGFGDWTIVDPGAPSAPLASSPFDGSGPFGFARGPDGPAFWHCGAGIYDEGRGKLRVVDRRGDRVLAEEVGCHELIARHDLVFAPVRRGDASALTWWDLAAAASGDVVALHPEWIHGDARRDREIFGVSADGTLVAVQRVAEGTSASPPARIEPSEPIAIFRRGAGHEASLPGDLRTLITPAEGATLVVEGLGGASWYTGAALGQALGVTPLVALGDGATALGRDGDGALLALDLATGATARVAPPDSAFLSAAGGTLVAIASPAGQASAGAWEVSLWRPADGAPPRLQTTTDVRPELGWVSADGHTLLELTASNRGPGGSTRPPPSAAGLGVALVGPDGATLWRDDGELRSSHATAWGLLVTLRDGHDRVIAVDRATGSAREVHAAQRARVAVDAAARRVAITVIPLAGGTTELHAGALLRP